MPFDEVPKRSGERHGIRIQNARGLGPPEGLVCLRVRISFFLIEVEVFPHAYLECILAQDSYLRLLCF